MFQSMIYMIMLLMSLLFIQFKHPLSMGFLLLLQTLNICLLMGMLHESFWFSYILFLVFLGGMLVLFIYVTSLASNEMFNFSFNLMLIMIFILLIMFFFSLLMDNMEITFLNNFDMFNFSKLMLNKENSMSIHKLYNFPTNLITLMLINYLFFTLIVVVKITNFYYGPLRNLI